MKRRPPQILGPREAFHGLDRGRGPHFWVTLTHPENGAAAVANFDSFYDDDQDRTCLVDPVEWRHLNRQSFVSYADAFLFKQAEYDRIYRFGYVEPLDPISPELFRRVREGALLDETDIPLGVQDRIRACCTNCP